MEIYEYISRDCPLKNRQMEGFKRFKGAMGRGISLAPVLLLYFSRLGIEKEVDSVDLFNSVVVRRRITVKRQ